MGSLKRKRVYLVIIILVPLVFGFGLQLIERSRTLKPNGDMLCLAIGCDMDEVTSAGWPIEFSSDQKTSKVLGSVALNVLSVAAVSYCAVAVSVLLRRSLFHEAADGRKLQ